MRKLTCLVLACTLSLIGFSQGYKLDSTLGIRKMQKDSILHALKMQRDSSYQAMVHMDSVKTEKEYAETVKWDKIRAATVYPILNAGSFSGVIPVKDPTEIPDPAIEYKLLFEMVANNSDSSAKDINSGLMEIVRVINLHVASGIPLKKITPVILVHGPALNAITTNAYFNEHFKMDNPNIKVVNDLSALGTKFIACGQAMAFFNIKRESLLPMVKISLTAQTVLTSYQLKGYIKIPVDK